MSDDIGFGLIHGGGHGAWCWERVITNLRHPAIAIDLPGRHARPETLRNITYEDWASSATAQIGALQADRIVLVAHSLGGITLPEVARRLADRVRHLVFVAAVMPPEGMAFADIDPKPELLAGYWPLPAIEAVETWLCNDMPPGAVNTLYPRLCAEPAAPLLSPISRLGMPNVGVTFVRPTMDATPCLADLDIPESALSREFASAQVVRINAGHNVMMTAPEAVAAVLNGIGESLR